MYMYTYIYVKLYQYIHTYCHTVAYELKVTDKREDLFYSDRDLRFHWSLHLIDKVTKIYNPLFELNHLKILSLGRHSNKFPSFLGGVELSA